MSSSMNSAGEATSPALIQSRRIRTALIYAAIAAAVAVVVAGTAHYYTVGRFMESTDDAYLKADSTTIAPKVSGYVSQLLVDDNQNVQAGQPLVRIDARDYEAVLEQAKASAKAEAANVSHLDAQLAEQEAVISQAQAAVAASEASLGLARLDQVRYTKMAHVGYGSEQQSQQASSHLRESDAEVSRQRAALLAAQRQVNVLGTQRTLAQAQLEHAQAVAHRAQLDVDDTTVIAPIDGTVGARTLRVGQYVQAGTQMMAVVPLKQIYLVANFKETQLERVHAGEPVHLHVDTFPDVDLHGHVDSLAPASGLEFSLLPPDNATGNFTKIVQRIPVKIVLDAGQAKLGNLRPGMSVEATIDTRGGTPQQEPSSSAQSQVVAVR
ncbi:HlyD family secretion protein [Rhodanobacter sp. MP7CTX1]|uniref:HlyD family secretion protein n=1 Tax=Rhodanobacter sp. MP7CTX1 TaxID=2723084 RepID=UPI0017A37A70|nr:HlyD family secretion protein [Rhodanobacter sp. MP7CTX1]MBB6187510.1 membrane fusion protein (multidrug efflux system) [Rhodanobacter sp. MP7CTX1]